VRWNIDPVLIDLHFVAIRWYGLFFVIGLLLAIRVLERNFRQRGFPERHAASLTLWLPIGMILGAHFGHLLFYEPTSFWKDPIRIVQIGYGLASHGGGAGALIALIWYTRRKKAPFLPYADAVTIAAVWIFPWVRLGNFFNSEIVGRVTTVPWAVMFERTYPGQWRHPSQIYEILHGIVVILVAVYLNRHREQLRPGFSTCFLLLLYFLGRLLIEYTKEYQTLSASFPFTMGQLLSMPLVLLCGYLSWRWRPRPSAR